MTVLWNNYYNKVKYQRQLGLDESGNIKYGEPEEINVRQVSGGESYIISGDTVSRTFSKEYQIPFEISEGDMIEGRIVKSVENSCDVFGNFHFCIAKVI